MTSEEIGGLLARVGDIELNSLAADYGQPASVGHRGPRGFRTLVANVTHPHLLATPSNALATLFAAAPELAREVLRLRRQLDEVESGGASADPKLGVRHLSDALRKHEGKSE